MPSFRVTLTIGDLRPGATPPLVIPAAAAAAAELTTLEAADLRIVRGLPHVIVRFTAEDAEIARQVAAQVATTTDALVAVLATSVTQLARGTWHPVHPDPGPANTNR